MNLFGFFRKKNKICPEIVPVLVFICWDTFIVCWLTKETKNQQTVTVFPKQTGALFDIIKAWYTNIILLIRILLLLLLILADEEMMIHYRTNPIIKHRDYISYRYLLQHIFSRLLLQWELILYVSFRYNHVWRALFFFTLHIRISSKYRNSM